VIVGGGERWSWGNSSCGQLGDGSTTRSYSPVKVKLQGKKVMESKHRSKDGASIENCWKGKQWRRRLVTVSAVTWR